MSEQFAINLLIGMAAGVLAGMFGIGGGVVIVPALILISGFTLIQANGTSLAALLFPVGILAVISYYKSGYINIKVSLYVAAGLMIGVVFGSWAALTIPASSLKLLYGFFLLYVSWNFMQPKQFFRKSENRSNISDDNSTAPDKDYPFLFFVLVGVLAGVLSGMFGIGGGLVIVPVLIAFLKYHPKKAIGTSLGALLLPVGLPGVIMYQRAGQLSIAFAFPVAAGLIFGALLGAKIMISLPTAMVKRIYSIFLLIIAFNFIWQALFR